MLIGMRFRLSPPGGVGPWGEGGICGASGSFGKIGLLGQTCRRPAVQVGMNTSILAPGKRRNACICNAIWRVTKVTTKTPRLIYTPVMYRHIPHKIGVILWAAALACTAQTI